MTIEEQFSEIILKTKGKEFFPFLKALSPAEKKLLVSPIKKITKEYAEYGELGGGSWGHKKGTEKQRNMLQIASFVCHSRVDYEKSQFSLWFLHKEQLKDIITWYVPDWFSDYVNKEASGDNFSLEYDWIIELMELGALQPSPELLVNSIPAILYEHKDKQWHYRFDNLLKYPITLQEHIWYLFDYPSNLHYSNRFLYFGKDVSTKDKDWHHAFITLVQEARIDRQRVLKESLLASNKNFNKVLSGWFADLFANLEPTTAELFALQKELVMTIHSPQSKPATMALQYLKKIIDEKELDVQAVLDALPVVLSNTTKGLVNAALLLMEQIANKQQSYRAAIAQLCCQVFIHPDESLQSRAAKLIGKYGDPADETVRSQLASSSESILQTPRKTLAIFLESKTADPKENPSISTAATTLLQPVKAILEPIPAIDTIDDLLFLAAQAFDNNESFHFDLLPAALVRMQDELKGAVISQLQPALQRAIQITRGGLRSTQGNYDQLLAVFFIDICIHLVRKYPADSTELKKLFDSYVQRKDHQAFDFLAIDQASIYLPGWESDTKDPLFIPLQQLLMEALEKIKQGDSLPLLSTPTHRHGWLDADTLIDRWIAYKHHGGRPGYTDTQLAIARCRLVNTESAVAKVKQEFQGELQHVLVFLLEADAEPQPPFTQPQFWMMAALSKQPKKQYAAFEDFGYYVEYEKYTGQFAWRLLTDENEYNRFDRDLGKLVKAKQMRKQLVIDFSWDKKNRSPGKPSKKPGSPPPQLIYDHFRISSIFMSSEHKDMRRALLMAPNNVEVLLPQVLHTCLRHHSSMSEDDKRAVIAALLVLHEIWDEQAEMAHVFLATSLLCLDKTAANSAAEIWLKYAPLEKIDNALFGRIIGIHEAVEYAPLKRLTDLIMQSLFRVSVAHNRMLQEIIENIIPELPDTPIKNLKKLLEILSELVVLNKQPVEDERVKDRLEVWKGMEGLRKVVEGMK